MEDFLFNCYLKFKKEHSSDFWEKINKLPRHLLILFIISIVSAVLSLGVFLVLGNPLWNWILIAIELFSTFALGFYTEKYSVDNSQIQIDNYINYCKDMYCYLCDNNIKTEEHIHEILNRINDKIADIQLKLDKKHDEINKLMQILFIPIVLAILKEFFDSSSELSSMVESSVLVVIFTLFAYSIIIGGNYLMNYDNIRCQNKLKCFASDLQGVLDVMVTFGISDDMKSLSIDDNDDNLNGQKV